MSTAGCGRRSGGDRLGHQLVELLAEMRPVVVTELRAAFAANLSDAQARDLREALERVRSSACGQS